MKKFLLFLSCLPVAVFPQYDNYGNVKLLFDIEGDLRNPAFFVQQYSDKPNSLIFELHRDSVSNIYLSDYSVSADSFLTPYPITFNNHLNINPCGISTSNQKIIFFQTNINGYWNFAYSEYNNGNWDSAKVIAASNSIDINPSVIKPVYFFSRDLISIVYQKNNSIYMFSKSDTSETNEAILNENDSTKYSHPAAYYSSLYVNRNTMPVLITAAIASNNLQNKKIVENIRSLNSIYDSTFVIDDGNVSNPQCLMNFNHGITYNKIENEVSSVYFYNQYNNTITKLALNDTLNGSFSNLQTENFIRVLVGKVKSKASYSISPNPYIYNFRHADSSYVCISKGSLPVKDTIICSKIDSLRSAVEFIAYNNNIGKEINYAVWEDSVNGSIKLKGLKIILPVPSNVNNKNIISSFILYQNYPNPFNLSTTIKYQIPKPGLVQLKVYDILGREVAVLVNEYQTVGEHSVFFTTDDKQQTTNQNQLSSGIYFYRLESGSYVQTKKLILLK